MDITCSEAAMMRSSMAHKCVYPLKYVRNALVAERFSTVRSHAVMVTSTDLDERRARLVVDTMI